MSDNSYQRSYVVVYDLTIVDGEQYSIALCKWLHEKDNITYLSYSTLKEYQKCLKMKRYPDNLWKVTAVAIDGFQNLIIFKGTTSSNTMDNDNNINIEDVPLVILPCIEKSTTNLPTKNSEMLPSETVEVLSNEKGYNLLKNVYEKLVKCEILLESHTDRLIKIERHLNIAPVHHEVTPLSMELPLKTIEDIEMFEISLLNDAQSSALVLKRTLGSNERTTLFKIFAKLFDYNLATLCSW
ncbi:hypothetical protein RN001_007544 [Aquatica leii]|uniref:Uncharacterized protein n=1 Tax=Aquatica leii TaxID=1421715 RepID=A0AAN7P9P0_9COLE|nr:hypothetical protein RN001_007544 [Aquatica leii]